MTFVPITSGIFVSVTRRRYAAGTYTNGKWVSGAKTDSTISASVQPVTSKEMLLLPEAVRTRGAVKIYTDTELRVADETSAVAGDRIVWDSEEWEVQRIDKWAMGQIDYWRAFAVRVND